MSGTVRMQLAFKVDGENGEKVMYVSMPESLSAKTDVKMLQEFRKEPGVLGMKVEVAPLIEPPVLNYRRKKVVELQEV